MIKKVKLSDLKPNPHMDSRFHYSRQRINELKEFIEEFGEYAVVYQDQIDDIVAARECNGQFQVLLGHHRLKVLIELFGKESEIEVDIVPDILDKDMVKFMAVELIGIRLGISFDDTVSMVTNKDFSKIKFIENNVSPAELLKNKN
jgi:ParB-like chromosome segregation protein Spo0J